MRWRSSRCIATIEFHGVELGRTVRQRQWKRNDNRKHNGSRHHNPPNSENEKGRIEQKLRRYNNSSGNFLASMERARDDKKPMNLRRLDP